MGSSKFGKKLLRKSQARAGVKVGVRKPPPQAPGQPTQEDRIRGPVIVQHTVVQPAVKPPPPRTFAPGAPRPTLLHGLAGLAGLIPQAPKLRPRAPLQPNPPRPPTPPKLSPAALLRKSKRDRRASRLPYAFGQLSYVSAYGGINDLRFLLGLANDGTPHTTDTVLVAIDTEYERQGLLDYVVEVGVTILRTKDIQGMASGDYIRDWTAKMEHRHLVLDVTRFPKERMRSSLFGKSMFVSADEARNTILAILKACETGQPIPHRPVTEPPAFTPDEDDAPPTRLALVGQSIDQDVRTLKGRPLSLNLYDLGGEGAPRFATTFDTYYFSVQAVRLGANLPSLRLGRVLRSLGVDRKYIQPGKHNTVKGTHNASNDAAYTMMALLQYALKWDQVVGPQHLPPAETHEAQPSEATTKPVRQPGKEGRSSLRPSSKRQKGRKMWHMLQALIFVTAGTALAELLMLFRSEDDDADV